MRNGGTVVVLGLGQAEATFPMAVLVRRAITLRGQFAYSRADFARAVDILAEGDLDLGWLSAAPLDDGAEAFANLVDRPAEYTKVILSTIDRRSFAFGRRRSPMSEPRFLVTGAYGCIGAWAVHELVAAGHEVTTFDLSTDPRRLRLLLDEPALEAVPHVAGDIADLDELERVLDERAITNVIHLAALQVPFCRADPPLGARVNVLGTVNVFEAAKRRSDRLAPSSTPPRSPRSMPPRSTSHRA